MDGVRMVTKMVDFIMFWSAMKYHFDFGLCKREKRTNRRGKEIKPCLCLKPIKDHVDIFSRFEKLHFRFDSFRGWYTHYVCQVRNIFDLTDNKNQQRKQLRVKEKEKESDGEREENREEAEIIHKSKLNLTIWLSLSVASSNRLSHTHSNTPHSHCTKLILMKWTWTDMGICE